VAEFEVAQLDVLRIRSAALRLIQGVLEQRVDVEKRGLTSSMAVVEMTSTCG